ncbi:MAG: hypothetical protein Q9218_005156 [Villophora microphyllina]
MYRTYNEAFVVLVLDQSLAAYDVKAIGFCEASLRIVLSRWVTRLWTLQEGALPARTNKLLFRFRDFAVQIWTLYHHVATVSHKTIQWRALASGIMRRFHTFTHLFNVDNPESQAAPFRDLVRALRYRSVTVPSDEPLIIATLLALDLNPILAEPPHSRMNTLWKLLGVSPRGIPKDLLFHIGPTLSEPGLRWAPRSLLLGNEHFFFRRPGPHDDQGYLITDGSERRLLVELAGLRINFAKPARGLPPQLAGYDSLPEGSEDRHSILMRDGQGVWYLVCHRLFGMPDCPPSLEELYASASKLSHPWILYHGSSTSSPGVKGYDGLLVDEVRESQVHRDQTLSVETKVHVKFGRLPMAGDHCCELVCRAACSLAKELASSAAAQRFQAFDSTTSTLENPLYVEAAQGVDLEIERLSKSPVAIEALIASGSSADEHGTANMNAYIERFYRGIYVDIKEAVPGDSKWFVD